MGGRACRLGHFRGEESVKGLRVMVVVCMLWACQTAMVWAEGFALTEWSSRGLSLAGGMVGRADDPSAIAYNAAGITQLPGTRVMGGFAAIAPMGTIDLDLANGGRTSTTTKPNIWPAPHAYITHQLNDRFWLGLGMFARFGLGNEFSESWTGRYNLTSVNFQTFSLVPTVAMKVNEVLSLSAGVEVMYAAFSMNQQIPSWQIINYFPQQGPDSRLTLDGTGWGAGLHVGAHFHMTDQLSLGITYKSPVTLNINGTVDYSRHHANLLADQGQVPHTIDTDAHSTVHLPDSFAVGLAYQPLDNLSFEVGTVFTRWSTYDSLNIYFDSDYQSISHKNWRDGWNFNASVEYEPLDWLALRAGIWYETPVINEAHADFMVPSNGRTGASVGAGFKWGNWTLDLAYAHLWVNGVDYAETDAAGIHSTVSGIRGGSSRDTVANIYSVSIGYTF
ncbi:MAG TPA: outer membrane protein transport protein [Candidatus Desulfovibrio intestinavium]|uniref:Outer membrane protein transport protein n=1 Tax=Candidatus Desulfovibrio intestinavium TaxID=2838534 RepID=A0A9D2HPH4_9BACT|nr:outer membrane protein transport protein [Candidatus Desulfovibrio intestinavium]